jgi:proteic killer suppression protein
MIKSFADKITETLFRTGRHKKVPPDATKRAIKQLDRLDAVVRIEDLYFPPSNNFEKLVGSKKGRYSIRVNRQYRLTFTWTGTDAESVCFEDYH